MAEKQLKMIEREKELLDKDQTVSTLREEVGISDLHSALMCQFTISVYNLSIQCQYAMSVDNVSGVNVAVNDSAALLNVGPLLIRIRFKISMSSAV